MRERSIVRVNGLDETEIAELWKIKDYIEMDGKGHIKITKISKRNIAHGGSEPRYSLEITFYDKNHKHTASWTLRRQLEVLVEQYAKWGKRESSKIDVISAGYRKYKTDPWG